MKTNSEIPVCAYCDGGAALAAFGIPVCELAASKVYLFREQSHRGRVIVASRRHVGEIVELTDAERNAFMADVARVARALHSLFHPQKVNYGAYGDTCGHLHFHLVPKYAADSFEWGGVFAMNPSRTFLTENEYEELVALDSAELLVTSGDVRKALETLSRRVAADGRLDFAESTLLLRALEPLAESDCRIAETCGLLKAVREDGVVTGEESKRILAALERLLA